MKYRLITTRWETDKNRLSDIRRKVFIIEQNVPEELEWDEDDLTCQHIIALDNSGSAVATGRIKADGHIGRMAVLKACRNSGIGTSVLNELITIAKNRKLNAVYLHAQTSAIAFYEKQGFKISSDEFMDAGIPHKTMQLVL
ncbi:GNAT family acetyltransferase YjcF [hydrothermal vent metagenome]|uniref:GNAT family acetyltransferase YjcF n=1 Tax=hydrothermal vent metagenome TaxID=652676 RepID=A0A3B0YQ74_9ZZZZ